MQANLTVFPVFRQHLTRAPTNTHASTPWQVIERDTIVRSVLGYGIKITWHNDSLGRVAFHALSTKAHENGENVTSFRGIAFVASDIGWP